ncbi:hypothetical protein B0T13DRAFT_89670 [Neurospora crassa]|nr:hypothetical protein B0T13DRAFT_89670 [Neurospora crassa]
MKHICSSQRLYCKPLAAGPRPYHHIPLSTAGCQWEPKTHCKPFSKSIQQLGPGALTALTEAGNITDIDLGPHRLLILTINAGICICYYLDNWRCENRMSLALRFASSRNGLDALPSLQRLNMCQSPDPRPNHLTHSIERNCCRGRLALVQDTTSESPVSNLRSLAWPAHGMLTTVPVDQYGSSQNAADFRMSFIIDVHDRVS